MRQHRCLLILILCTFTIFTHPANIMSQENDNVIETEQLLLAPERIELDGLSYTLEVTVLQCGPLRFKGQEYCGVIAYLSQHEKQDIPPLIDIVSVWVILRKEVWASEFYRDVNGDVPSYTIGKRTTSGPPWELRGDPEAIVTVVDGKGNEFLIRDPDPEIRKYIW